MEIIDNIEEAEKKVLSDMEGLIFQIREYSKEDICDLKKGLATFRAIRSSVYENLNQIQHEYLIVQGLIHLKQKSFSSEKIKWHWNPRQTGDSKEPDLQGTKNNSIIISAEASASENPKGSIDKHMAKTLKKLDNMEGEKYYFVRTETMQKRAITKVSKNELNVTVVRI